MFGIAIATSEMAVGSRCIHVSPGVGAVVTQASTNPRLGHLGLNLLRAGYSAPRVLEEIAANGGRRDVRYVPAGRRSRAVGRLLRSLEAGKALRRGPRAVCDGRSARRSA